MSATSLFWLELADVCSWDESVMRGVPASSRAWQLSESRWAECFSGQR